MATYGDMQTRIAAEIGRVDSTTALKNSIQDAITGFKNWRFLFNELSDTLTTIAGTSDYTTSNGLPTGIIEIDEMTVAYGGATLTLSELTASQYAIRNASIPQTQGVPTYYSWYGETLRLYPTPDAIYTVTMLYHGELSALSADADTNAWTNKGEVLIRNTAKADLCANVLRDPQAAQLAQSTADLAFRALRREYESRTLTGRLDPND